MLFNFKIVNTIDYILARTYVRREGDSLNANLKKTSLDFHGATTGYI